MSNKKLNLDGSFTMSVIRCSTSVPANYRAARLSQTKAGFISKISIVVEEADEGLFWLEFIIDEKLLPEEKVTPLMNEADELRNPENSRG